jgi:hypothetical protein
MWLQYVKLVPAKIYKTSGVAEGYGNAHYPVPGRYIIVDSRSVPEGCSAWPVYVGQLRSATSAAERAALPPVVTRVGA